MKKKTRKPKPDYSCLKLFIGFAIAALMAWKLTVNSVTTNYMPLFKMLRAYADTDD